MKKKQMMKFLLLIIFIIAHSSCASFDDYLETSLSKEPAVIFDCNISEIKSDTLVIMVIKSASIPSERMKSKAIEFYLKNTNKNLSLENVNSTIASDFIKFSFIYINKSDKFLKDFPELSGMNIFAVYLKGLTVDKKNLSSLKTLGNGEWRNISSLNAEIVKQKKIFFVIKNMSFEDSKYYKKIIANTYRINDM